MRLSSPAERDLSLLSRNQDFLTWQAPPCTSRRHRRAEQHASLLLESSLARLSLQRSLQSLLRCTDRGLQCRQTVYIPALPHRGNRDSVCQAFSSFAPWQLLQLLTVALPLQVSAAVA